jgi:hypothetical protein
VRPVHAGGEGARELKFRETVSVILLVIDYFITLQASWIMLVPRRGNLTIVALLPLFLVFVLVAIVMLARLGQGGSRMPATDEPRIPNSSVPVGDRTLDRYWKLGVFYFNPTAPSNTSVRNKASAFALALIAGGDPHTEPGVLVLSPVPRYECCRLEPWLTRSARLWFL